MIGIGIFNSMFNLLPILFFLSSCTSFQISQVTKDTHLKVSKLNHPMRRVGKEQFSIFQGYYFNWTVSSSQLHAITTP